MQQLSFELTATTDVLQIASSTPQRLRVAGAALRRGDPLLQVLHALYGEVPGVPADDVVALVQMPDRPHSLQQWLDSGKLNWLVLLLFAEFAFAVLADILGRVVSLIDSLLSERVTNASSVRLMQHAATLDLEDFEDAEFQDQLERARRHANRAEVLGYV